MIRHVLSVFATASLPLAGQVSFTGLLSEGFDSMETGSAPPAGWSVIGQIAGDNDAWITEIPAAGNPSAASTGVTDNLLIVNSDADGGAVGSSGGKAFNLALAGSVNDRCLGTSPTGVAGIALEFRMVNDTGASIAGLRVSYHIRRLSSAPLENQLPGYWLFYSMDGGATWTNAASLNPQALGGLPEVPNSTGTTVVPATNLWLPAPLADAGELRLRWVDDNAQESSPDQVLGLDSVTLEALPVDGPPTIDLVSPLDLSEVASSAVTLEAAVDDPEDDGTANMVEYFFGTDPADAASREFVRVQSVGQGSFVIRYPRAKNRPDVVGTLEWSGNLAGAWFASGGSNGAVAVVFTESVVSAPGADPEMIEAAGVVSGSPTGLFVRLRVE